MQSSSCLYPHYTADYFFTANVLTTNFGGMGISETTDAISVGNVVIEQDTKHLGEGQF